MVSNAMESYGWRMVMECNRVGWNRDRDGDRASSAGVGRGRKLHGQSSEKRKNLNWMGMEFAKSEDDGMGRVDGEGRTGGGTYLGSQVRRR